MIFSRGSWFPIGQYLFLLLFSFFVLSVQKQQSVEVVWVEFSFLLLSAELFLAASREQSFMSPISHFL